MTRHWFLFLILTTIPFLQLGMIGRTYGLHHLLQTAAPSAENFWTTLPYDARYASSAAYIFFCSAVALFLFTSDLVGRRIISRAGILRKIALIAPLLIVGILVQLFVNLHLNGWFRESAEGAVTNAMRGLYVGLFGIGAGLLTSTLIIVILSILHRCRPNSHSRHQWFIPAIFFPAALIMFDGLLVSSAIWSLFALVVGYYMVIVTVPVMHRFWLTAVPLGIVILFAAFYRPYVVEGLYVKVNLCSGNEDRQITEAAAVTKEQRVNPVTALNSWRRRISDPRPTLIVLAASGGGYRATFWTALVLDRIGQLGSSTETFFRDVRLVTGASGGMVALAYVVAMSADLQGVDPPSITQQIRGDVAKKLREVRPTIWYLPNGYTASSGQDSGEPINGLTPIAQAVLWHDLWDIFALGRLSEILTGSESRVRALESQWQTLDQTIGSFALAEASGAAPSAIFSPMVVETGQPLLITNLKITPQQTVHCLGPAEFIEVSHEARERMTLATASRLSAAFAPIVPAAVIAADPERHVIDAGYHDNLGVDSATTYLATPEVRDWVRRNNAQVVVIQLRGDGGKRARESTESDRRLCTADPSTERDGLGYIGRAFSAFSTVSNSLLSAREAGNNERAERQLRLLAELYPPGALHSFAFVNSAEVSMSWYLTFEEYKCLSDELDSDRNRKAFGALTDILNLRRVPIDHVLDSRLKGDPQD